jgi:LuxR family quorum sensing-dependent transcriptional regulator
MITNEIIDFLDGLAMVTSGPSLVAAMKRTLNKLGVEYFCLNFLPKPNQSFKDVMLVTHLPSGWLDLYIQQGFAHHDPSLRQCRSVVHPFRYQDAPFDPAIEPEVLEVVQRAADFSIDNGLVVPVPDSGGIIGDVWMGGGDAKLESRSIQLLHLLALYSFDHAQRVVGIAKPEANLTEREKEVLKWIACGKCADEVGEILNISRRTVEWHVGEVMQKLSAKTRTQAVIIAHRARLIEL